MAQPASDTVGKTSVGLPALGGWSVNRGWHVELKANCVHKHGCDEDSQSGESKRVRQEGQQLSGRNEGAQRPQERDRESGKPDQGLHGEELDEEVTRPSSDGGGENYRVGGVKDGEVRPKGGEYDQTAEEQCVGAENG